jgi:anti-sigma regulatory factor (Ser/Thr protein kinase)
MQICEDRIAHLTIQNKLEFLPDALSMVRGITSKLGLQDKDVSRMELVVEEACVNVIEHAFEGQRGTYDITIIRRPGQIVVAVEDRGLPIDFEKLEEGQISGLGTVLMRTLADEVHFMNMGRDGKRVELVKNVPEKNLECYLEESDSLAASGKVGTAPYQEADISIRLMRPDETVSLARCAYRCYGFTYSTDNLYFPERVREMVESGIMVSVVAVDPQGEVIGHFAVVKESPEALVGETGQAIVDPRYRSQGILKKMGIFLSNLNQSAGMLGTYSEVVTVHPYSQKSGLSRGYLEMGVLLGFTPASMYFKDIQRKGDAKRRPVVLFYKWLNQEPLRDIYLPPHYALMLDRIYRNAKLRRNFISAPMQNLPTNSRVNVKVQTEASRAFLLVVEYGQDLVEVIRLRLRELCLKRLECIYLDLPLTHSAIQHSCEDIEKLGFFFGGLLPELHSGDILRLQYFNNAELELEDIHLASAFSRELYRYVLIAGGLPISEANAGEPGESTASPENH